MKRAGSRVLRGAHHRDSGVPGVSMLAGWLFADLFLVLFIVAFASQPAVPVKVSKPKPQEPTHAATPFMSPTSHPSPSSKPLGVEQNPQNIIVKVSPLDVDNPTTRASALAHLLSNLHNQLARLHLTGDTAGFVVIFATSVTGDPDPVDEAVKVANSVLPVLKKDDAALFGHASGEGFWGGANGDYFHFQIFFFTH